MQTMCTCLRALLLSASVVVFHASWATDTFVHAEDVAWRFPGSQYDEAFAKAFRFKTLVGGAFAPVQASNVYFGEAQWAPGAIYVGHKHPAPEIYYVISGEAEWTVNGKTFRATAGTAIYTPPN